MPAREAYLDGASAGVAGEGAAPQGLAGPLHHHTREDEYSYVLEGRRPAIPATIRRLGGAGGQFDEPGGELGGLGVAERGERAPGVEVDGGAGGGVDPLAAASAGTERLGEDLAGLVEVAQQAALDDGAQGGKAWASRRTFAVIGSVSRYQA